MAISTKNLKAMRNYSIFLLIFTLVSLSGCGQIPSKSVPTKIGTSPTEVADTEPQKESSTTVVKSSLDTPSEEADKQVKNVSEMTETSLNSEEATSATVKLAEVPTLESVPVTEIHPVKPAIETKRGDTVDEAEKIRKFQEATRAAQREVLKLKREILKDKPPQSKSIPTVVSSTVSPGKIPERGKNIRVTVKDISLEETKPVESTDKLASDTLPEYCRSPKKADLWCRIRRGYALQVENNEAIDNALQQYLKSEGYLRRTFSRARPYLYHIVKEIDRRKLPMELALLPAVESAYQSTATSPKSAAGLWQFIPNTGENYGLEQNAWYDERRDVIASTAAALTYLQRLHKLFDGDWLRALAAYNWGEGNVQRAIKKNQDEGQPTDYWSLDLPAETRQYVPKLIALSKIIADPSTYSVKLDIIADRPYLRQVEVNNQISLTVAAQLAGMSKEEFQRLNAAYRRSATAPQGPHKVTLPIYKTDKFKKGLAGLKTEDLMPPEAQAIVAQEIQRDGGTAIDANAVPSVLPVTDNDIDKQLTVPAVGELATVPTPRRAN
ncbi:MAG: hypothetical protein BWK79_16515 [Beggiatoa sp. IS2]|nr:MAG: hypothetical protein BWK79_16515 [Beggiatoa sp. IS2]